MTILTDYRPKPIPFRGCDWTAWIDGREENGCGHGRTRDEAIADLMSTIDGEVA